MKALFLDRDGVINKDFGYVHDPSNFIFDKDIFELVKKANSLDYIVIVITNQAGIAKGYYDVAQFKFLTAWMNEKFEQNLCKIDAVYFCPYHPDGIVPEYRVEHFDRKPKPGMFLKAAKDFAIDMTKSILIGDKISDIEAGLKSRVGTNFLYIEKRSLNSMSPNYNVITSLTEVTGYLSND
jgi:D-glycero-D-manno-heptose 1,7-bisphosphate phosphatase